LAAALRAWASFPVRQNPRPIVLVAGSVNAPRSGFASGADKLAYLSADFRLATPLPTTTSVGGTPVISADRAYALLHADAEMKQPAGTTALVITAVRLDREVFDTDRGPQSLPAWLFLFKGVADPAEVLAIAPGVSWSRNDAADPLAIESATISSDGRTVVVRFVGAAPGSGPCSAEYGADLAESDTSVAVSIHQVTSPTPVGTAGATNVSADSTAFACSSIGYFRTVALTLHRLLGNRVVTDNLGNPVAVT
jgi:hypothetical protein